MRAAEKAGYDSVWVAESYGSDVVSVLAWLAPQTETIRLGAAIMQVPARPPAAAAMAGCTIDALSGGRFIFGFGPSGPQVSEGWYGVPYAKPWGRTREYIEIVRAGFAITDDGRSFQLLEFRVLRGEDRRIFISDIGRNQIDDAGNPSRTR